jgi:hypothetical protein
MSNKVLVKPKPNSKKFFEEAKMYQGVMRQNPDGSRSEEEARELGAYRKEKFLGSRQITRIPWSSSKGRYLTGDLEGEELDKVVVKCKLRDSDGKLITAADRTVYDDPFFQHKHLKIHFEEGEQEIDLDHPVNYLLYQSMTERSTFKSSSNNNPAMSARTKYILTDEMQLNSNTTRQVDEWIEIGQLLGGLDSKMMKKVAIAMNLGVQSNSSAETVKNTLAKTLKEAEGFVSGTTETHKQLFSRLVKGSSEDLNLDYMITLAKRKGFLRRKKEQGWLFNGKPIATTDGALLSYFKDVANQDDYFELENLVGDSSKNVTSKSKSKVKSDK